MGIFDQNKQWDFDVDAAPEQCVAAFFEAFEKGGALRAASWSFDETSDPRNGHHYTATFRGRKGVGGFLTALGKNTSEIAEAAIGSEIAFSAVQAGATTSCSMWLKSATTRMGLKNEASLFRHYMRAVEAELLKLDQNLSVSKG